MVGTIACHVSSGFCQNAHSSSMMRSALQPRQDDGLPGRDIILEPLLNVMQDAFACHVMLPLERVYMASANFRQVLRASEAALNPVERYITRALRF